MIPTREFGATFEDGVSVVFRRRDGTRIASIANPPDVFRRTGFPTLYADGLIFVQTLAGCCGAGISVFDSKSLNPYQFISRPGTNAVERRNQWLVAGSEGGWVDVFDLSANPSPLVANVNLRQLTVHNGSEDSEIRALWLDGNDNYVFAASSWGNDQSRGPLLPSFFVLRMKVSNDF